MTSEISIDNHTLAAAWRGLVLGMLLHTVRHAELATKVCRRKNGYKFLEDSINKNTLQNETTAMRWLEGGMGLVTWEEACEVLGVDPDRARNALLARCKEVSRKPGCHLAPSKSDLVLCTDAPLEKETREEDEEAWAMP